SSRTRSTPEMATAASTASTGTTVARCGASPSARPSPAIRSTSEGASSSGSPTAGSWRSPTASRGAMLGAAMRRSLGTGPLPRLLAPGVPDWIGADGVRVGWALRDRLFLRAGDHVDVVELPDEVEEVAASPRRWTVALGNGFVRVDPEAG